MNFHIITLFPNSFDSYLSESILKRAIEDKKLKVSFYNPRDFVSVTKQSLLRGKSSLSRSASRIDRPPFGGGPGMVIQALPVIKAIEKALKEIKSRELKAEKRALKLKTKNLLCLPARSTDRLKTKIIFLSPGGKQFDNTYAAKTAKTYSDVIIVCGRYEGIDARIKKVFKMDDISIGPFVLTGGELPAMFIIDAMARQVKGVLGNFDSLEESRVSSHDVYTRPEIFEYKGKKYKAPKVLLSGNPKLIDEWKKRSVDRVREDQKRKK